MPRTNRVTPFGTIIATPERGTVMGNRGILHDVDGRVRRAWQGERWLLCVIEFRGRHRMVMAPNRYTELFFLDEATGLAAGHRPCFECRRASYFAFRDAWAAAFVGLELPIPVVAEAIDAHLYAERVGPERSKHFFRGRIDDLPDGAFIRLDGPEDRALLVRRNSLLEWSRGGYIHKVPRPTGVIAAVLTPPSTVAAIREGDAPGIHPSAKRI